MFHVSRQAQHSQFTYYNFTLSQITEIKTAWSRITQNPLSSPLPVSLRDYLWKGDPQLTRLKCNAPINGLPQDWGGGQPTGIWLHEALPGWGFWHPQRSPGRVENLTRLPSWKVERVWKGVVRHLGNTQKSFGWASHILCLAFLFMSDGRTNVKEHFDVFKPKKCF